MIILRKLRNTAVLSEFGAASLAGATTNKRSMAAQHRMALAAPEPISFDEVWAATDKGGAESAAAPRASQALV